MANITKGLLAAGHSVKVVTLSTPKHPLRLDAIPAELREATGVEGVFVDTRINPVDAFNDLVTSDNYNISRFFSPDLDMLLERTLRQGRFDLVHLESLFMTPYIPTVRRFTKAPVVLRSHNLEHVVQKRLADGERNFLKRPYRQLLARQLRRYEHASVGMVDGLVAITPGDAAHFERMGTRTRIRTVPFGTDVPVQAVAWPAGPLRFFHLGSMDWAPNVEGIRWFLAEVWPTVIARRPEARLHLAGNHMPADLLRNELPGVHTEGYVHDAAEWMAKRHVMVVPLLSAGGMRVKIVEGMALGRPVISTLRGAEGMERAVGEGLWVEPDAAAFADRMEALLDEQALAEQGGAKAYTAMRTHFDNTAVVRRLLELYAELGVK